MLKRNFIMAILAIAFSSYGQEVVRKAPPKDDLLDRLVGSWTLTGKMSSTPLKQRVEAKWVLRGRFLQMHFVSEGPTLGTQTPYEATYMIGYDSQSNTYVLHLFDTFGATYSFDH